MRNPAQDRRGAPQRTVSADETGVCASDTRSWSAPSQRWAACLCFGVLNFFGPLEGRRVPLLTFIFFSQSIAAGVLIVAILIAGVGPPPLAGIGLGVACGLVNVIALAVQYHASRTGPIGVISVIVAVGVVIPVAAGLVAGERPGLPQTAGMILAFTGAAIATLGADRAVVAAPGDATFVSRSPVRRHVRSWVLPAVVSSLAFGSFLVLFAKASEENLTWAMMTTRASMAVATLVAGLIWAPRLLLPAGRVLVSGALGTLMVVATGLYAVSATVGLLSVAAVLTAVSAVVTVSLAWSLLGERLRPPQAAGVAVALVGLVLVVA